MWNEIRRELEQDCVRPTTPDEEALSAICKEAEDTAMRVAAEQESILQRWEEEDTREEELVYTEVRRV